MFDLFFLHEKTNGSSCSYGGHENGLILYFVVKYVYIDQFGLNVARFDINSYTFSPMPLIYVKKMRRVHIPCGFGKLFSFIICTW